MKVVILTIFSLLTRIEKEIQFVFQVCLYWTMLSFWSYYYRGWYWRKMPPLLPLETKVMGFTALGECFISWCCLHTCHWLLFCSFLWICLASFVVFEKPEASWRLLWHQKPWVKLDIWFLSFFGFCYELYLFCFLLSEKYQIPVLGRPLKQTF